MISILTSYSEENCAKVEKKHISYSDLYPTLSGRLYSKNGDKKESTPLTQAIATKNEDVITSIIRSYKDPLWLFNDFKKIKGANLMRCWIQQNYFLWKGTEIEVDNETVDLFLETTLLAAIQESNALQIQLFLDYGWIISKEEFEAATPEIVLLLLQHERFQPDVNPFDIALEKGQELGSFPFSESYLKAIAKHDQVQLFQDFFDQADFALLQECFMIAVENGSLGIVETFVRKSIHIEGGLVTAVQKDQRTIVHYFLNQKLYQEEIDAALQIAYERHNYELVDDLLNTDLNKDQVLRFSSPLSIKVSNVLLIDLCII